MRARLSPPRSRSRILRAHALGIVLVIGQQRPADAMAGQQFQADPGILAKDGIGALQDLERAQADIAGIADGRCNDHKAAGFCLSVRLPGRAALARLAACFRLAPGSGLAMEPSRRDLPVDIAPP